MIGSTYIDRGRVGEDRGSKETDGCPLTKSLTCGCWSQWLLGITLEVVEANRGEEWSSKGMDGCPSTLEQTVRGLPRTIEANK
jgi:hypothetical protein